MHISGAPSTGGGRVSSSLMPKPSQPLVELTRLGMIGGGEHQVPEPEAVGHEPDPVDGRAEGGIHALPPMEDLEDVAGGIRTANEGVHAASGALLLQPGSGFHAMFREPADQSRKVCRGAFPPGTDESVLPGRLDDKACRRPIHPQMNRTVGLRRGAEPENPFANICPGPRVAHADAHIPQG